MKGPRMFALGTSAGGVNAVTHLLGALPAHFSTPLTIVQHLPANSTADVRMIFGRHTRNTVVEIEDKMPIEPGHIYFAPPAYHVLIESSQTFALSQDEPVNFSRPSIDVFFESAAAVYESGLAGIVLTGANDDGARGMKAIQMHGGMTIVQNPQEAEVSTMPNEVLRLIKPDHILGLNDIANLLGDLSEGGPLG